jgi:hypothetical protein
MKNIKYLSFFLCLVMACAKEGPPGPKGPDGPPYTWPPGNITGYIALRDQFGFVMDRKDSVLLQTYNADSIFRAYTDTSGYFNLQAIPPGNYDISISKPGFDSLHLYVQHAGGEIDKFAGITSMSQHVTTKLLTLSGSRYFDETFGSVRIPVELEFEWPFPGRNLVSGFAVFLDTSAVPGAGRTELNFPLITSIDNVKGKLTGRFGMLPSFLTKTLYLTAVAVPAVTGSWFNYTTGTQVPYPYSGDSIKTTLTYTE